MVRKNKNIGPEAGDEPIINMKKEIMIDIEKLVPCRWRTGIRDPEKFELLKINIKRNGLNNPIIVRPIGDGNFEVFIGDHRLKACKDLGWKEIPCIVENITEQEAMKKCVADNVARADYSAVEMENWVWKLKQSNKDMSNEELGNAIGLTKQRIGQLLTAKEDRDTFNEMLEKEGSKPSLQIGTRALLDSRPLINVHERFALLKEVQKGKYSANEVGKIAKTLNFWDVKLRNKVLYQEVDFHSVIAEQQHQATKSLKKKETKTVRISDPSFTETLYDQLTEGLKAYLLTLPVSGETRTRAFNYLKMSMAVMAQELYRCEKITEKQFEQIRDDILGLFRDNLYGYHGEHLQAGIEKWGGEK